MSSEKTGTIVELLQFFWRERLWLLIPLVLTILVVVMLLIFAQVAPVAPFLYALF